MIYRVAYKRGFTWFWYDRAMSYKDALAVVRSLIIPQVYSPSQVSVIAAPDLYGLEQMLYRIHYGRKACWADAGAFLSGAFTEDIAEMVYNSLMEYEGPTKYTHTFTPVECPGEEVPEYIMRAMQESMERVFKNSEDTDPTPIPDRPTVEEEAVNPDHADKRWSWNWTGAERNRLNFFKWLLGVGRLEGDTHSEDVVEA